MSRSIRLVLAATLVLALVTIASAQVCVRQTVQYAAGYYPNCPGYHWQYARYVSQSYLRYLGRPPTDFELRRGITVIEVGGYRAFDFYFKHVVLPHHQHGSWETPGLSREECLDFQFGGQRPSAMLKMRIDKTPKENLKVLLQRCIFCLTYDPDPLARGTATWVREQICLIMPPSSPPPPTIPPSGGGGVPTPGK